MSCFLMLFVADKCSDEFVFRMSSVRVPQVVTEGEVGEAFYIIASGEASDACKCSSAFMLLTPGSSSIRPEDLRPFDISLVNV